MIGSDWRYLYVNDAIVAQTGRSREQLLGRTMRDCYPGIEDTAMFSELRRCMSERAHHRMENEFTFPDGSVGWFELRFVPVPAGVCILSADTTEKRRAERALLESEEMFRGLHAVAPNPVLLVSTAGTILLANKEADRTFGFAEGGLAGTPVEELIPAAERGDYLGRWREAFERTRSGKIGQAFNLRAQRRDGATLPVDVSIGPCSYRGNEAFLGIVRDMTDRNNLERQLQQAQKMESIGRLAGGVAHDFNNMLGVILGHVEMALEQVAPSHDLHEALWEIRSAARRSADLTRQLLVFARKQMIAPKALDLNETVGDMLKMLQRLIGENVELSWKPCSGVWRVMVDPSQVDQILANLCVNARDAIAGIGKLAIETGNATLDDHYCASHAEVAPGDYVRLSVSDDGCGMDKETLGRLFEPFFTTKARGKGTGLGLATVYGIVKQNHGLIYVYSEPGQGTTFTIYLPRHTAADERIRAVAATAPALRGSETILLVEDEVSILKVTAKMLEQLGYSVLSASTPGEALRLAREHPGEIHLLVTDVVMPEMNGRELAEEMVSRHPGIKRLFMSGYAAEVVASQGVLEEGICFVHKPFSGHELASKVRQAIDHDLAR